HRLSSLKKDGPRIIAMTCENGDTFRAKIFVDATYEGDLLAKAGVSFHVGRESNATFGETINGIQYRNTHNFIHPVDPYRIEGDSASGLLWGISSEQPGKAGDGDRRIQAYNFRFCVTN